MIKIYIIRELVESMEYDGCFHEGDVYIILSTKDKALKEFNDISGGMYVLREHNIGEYDEGEILKDSRDTYKKRRSMPSCFQNKYSFF